MANPEAESALWTSHNSVPRYVTHYGDWRNNLKDPHIALPQLTGAYNGVKMAVVVSKTLQLFSINPLPVGYFVLHNASNNDSAVLAIALKIGFNTLHRRLWSELTDKGEFMREWRCDGLLGVFLSVSGHNNSTRSLLTFSASPVVSCLSTRLLRRARSLSPRSYRSFWRLYSVYDSGDKPVCGTTSRSVGRRGSHQGNI
jgi:hypothetical protein